jgi:hypothetical protein
MPILKTFKVIFPEWMVRRPAGFAAAYFDPQKDGYVGVWLDGSETLETHSVYPTYDAAKEAAEELPVRQSRDHVTDDS